VRGQRLSTRRSHRRRIALRSPSLRVPRWSVILHAPRLARHTHVTRRTSLRHKFAPWSQVLGIGSEVVAGGRPAAGMVKQARPLVRQIPSHSVGMADVGGVPVNHHVVRAGQDSEDLVGVLFDEGRHSGISTQILLAREARTGRGGAGTLPASGSAGLGEARSSPPGGTHTSVALALQPFSPWPGLPGPSTEDVT